MATYSIEDQRRMDQVDLTEGKMGSGYMVSISLEEYHALKDAVYAALDHLTSGPDSENPPPGLVIGQLQKAVALVAKPDSASVSTQQHR